MCPLMPPASSFVHVLLKWDQQGAVSFCTGLLPSVLARVSNPARVRVRFPFKGS